MLRQSSGSATPTSIAHTYAFHALVVPDRRLSRRARQCARMICVGAMPRALVAAWRAVLGYVWWTEAVVVTRWEGRSGRETGCAGWCCRVECLAVCERLGWVVVLRRGM
jgi:hypothetical protein